VESKGETTIEEEFEKRENKKNEAIDLIIYIGVLVLLSFLIVTFIGQRTVVSGDSMNDTLHNGDSLLIDKISYRFSDPNRFDIVVFPKPTDPKVYYIKRIIGLPGETVQISSDGTIYIDGKELKENYGKAVIIDPGRAVEPVKLGKDEYFVMGDNRNNSLDSRFYEVGNIKRSAFIGRTIVGIYPFNQIRSLIPKDRGKAVK